MVQLRMLGPTALKIAYLEAPESPRHAFYRIWLEVVSGGIRVRKESGAGSKVLHRQAWEAGSFKAAERIFDRIVRTKTRQTRNSTRKYRVVMMQEF